MLQKHFALFGEIDYFTLHLKLSYCYGFIQYDTVYGAAAALATTHHFVSRFRIKVSMADSWHQPVTKTDDAATQADESTKKNESQAIDSRLLNILDLNDDCLYDIFNMLNTIDLSSVDQTCVRFQRVAGDVFRRNHTAINLTTSDLPGYSNVGTGQLTLLQIRNIFMGYGPLIQKLQVTALSFKQENRYRVLDQVIRSCTTLKSLHLTGFHIKVSKESHYFSALLFYLKIKNCSNEAI